MDISDIKEIYGTRTPGVIGRHRFYAVLVPFCLQSDTLSLLYEVRSGSVSQPGEICFPGGHMEEGETPEECAVRETCEELGIGRNAVEVIGQGDTLYGNGNFTLYTFIGKIDPGALNTAEPDDSEVGEIFFVPLDRLLEETPEHYGEKMRAEIDTHFPYDKVGIGRDYSWRTPSNDIPVYDIDGRVIWGLTGRITENVIETLKKIEMRASNDK
ncbi:MAG: CoA pyrophosphatase [Eubacterium sp.]|nr:CoA pyrophosphatase [Eubacterium sp.]